VTEGDEALGLSNIRAADVASLSETDEPCRIHKDCRCWEEATEDSMHFLVQQSTPFLWAITMHGLQA
jgi:hypothetical protein